MTLDIFFERYLLTLHAIVVAFGLIVYVGVARALPQRRDPSAAIAWVVALALLPYVAIPLYLMFGSRKLLMRDAPALLPPIAPAAAGDDEAASLWARRLGRSMGLAPAAPYEALHIHADGAEARRAVLDVIAGATRTLDVCTFILGRDRLGDEVAAALRAKAGQGVRVRLLIDGIGAWLVGPPRRPRAAPRRGRGGHLRAAVSLDPARPRQPAQPPQDDRRRPIAALVRRAQLRRRVFRRRSRPRRRASSGTTSASTCTASSESVPASSSRRTGTTRPGAAAAPTSFPRRTGSCRPTHRSPSWCRAAPSRSTTPCRRCSCRAASWRSGASSP